MESTSNTTRYNVAPRAPRLSFVPSGKRGVTPSKTGNQQKQEKPKLSAQQQLAILRRLEKRDFVKGAGLAQFYENPNNPSRQKEDCKQNLQNEFEKMEAAVPSSSQATPSGAAGSLFSSTVLSGGSDDHYAQMTLEHDMYACIDHMKYGIEKDYSTLPPSCKEFDQVIFGHQIFVKTFMTAARNITDRDFEDMFPKRKIFFLLYRMRKLTAIVNKFLKKPEFEKTKLFFEFGTGKKGSTQVKERVWIALKEQPAIFAAFEKMPSVLERVDNLLEKISNGTLSGPVLAGKLEYLGGILEKLEEGLTSLEFDYKEQQSIEDKAYDLEMDGASDVTSELSSSSSSSSSN